MSFDVNQPSHRQFRETLKLNTVPVVVWAGAGLSMPSGLPNWTQLQTFLTGRATDKRGRVDKVASEIIQAHLKLAHSEKSAWKKFEHLKQALGNADYTSSVREAFQDAGKVEIPDLYLQLWELGINGFFTLNIDRLASRAFSATKPGSALREFEGVNSQRHADVFLSGHKFVLNLHGSIDDAQSWVFTNSEFEQLGKNPGYHNLVNACFTTRVVLFVGISAEDQAAGGHLEKLKKLGINLNNHFWLTHRNDQETVHWAGEAGLNLIFYEARNNDHSELDGFVSDLLSYIPRDQTPPPVEPPVKKERGVVIPPSDELERQSANDIRIALNNEAKRILSSNNPNKIKEYETFLSEYGEAVYRAWSISTTKSKNHFFDYILNRQIAKGAFGQVFEATSKDGNRVAIKVLHGDIREEPHMLISFRRGVQSMRILSERHVDGMVPYLAAWEVPTSSVMELIEGPNLEDAVNANYVNDWNTRLQIARELTRIIRAAHVLPERVLHRDIRPANIMLKGYYDQSAPWELVVLDFDLSWHRDATEGSLNLATSSNGYLSPEQIDQSRKKLTRNALIDSYGLGMTIFFLVTGLHPKVGQHLYVNWHRLLNENVCSIKCHFWESLPYRVARLINWATKDKQEERWDVTRMHGELIRLSETQKGASNVISAEMFAEEIVTRCPELLPAYIWDDQKLSAICELRSGFLIQAVGDESQKKVKLHIDWMQTGDRKFENVKKYIDSSAEKSCSCLKKGGWKITTKGIATGECHIQAELNISDLQKPNVLEAVAIALNGSIAFLRLH